ncbi:hypothetical protein GCM10009798_16030 [Nocardioides panacihumi]|uniref:FHA domain-containing protein n=1 Tax=Nocardioides panacihumi TaxID=400774 RepID=A0ABN2QSR2_9ACTN
MPTVAADLEFSVQVGDRTAHGSLRNQRGRLVLDVDDPVMFAGSGDAAAVRAAADMLAGRSLVLEVVSRGRRLITLGAVTAPWWQRRITRSRHIRLGSARGAWTSARARIDGRPSVIPESALAPPSTLFPLAPTLHRRPRGQVATTHDPARGGAPRLVEVRSAVWTEARPTVHWLEEVTWIGSDPACEVRLEGLAPRHAKVVHDEEDEYVVVPVDGAVQVHGARVQRQRLRTGARVDLGGYTLVFRREEYADHGRPYGGRIGGELGHQRPQPPRSATPDPDGDTPVD